MAISAVAFLTIAVAGAAAADDRIVVNPKSPYPEGPVAVGNDVYYAEMGSDRVMRWDGHGNAAVWSRPGCGPTSVARGGGDTLVVLCDMEQVLVRITTDGKTVQVIKTDSDGRPFLTPNASINDAKGGIYWTSSGLFSPTSPSQGAVLYLDKAGGLHRLAEGIHYSNGVALSPDGKILYVSEHLSRRVLAYDVAADGSLSHTRVFVKLDDLVPKNDQRGWEVGADGLAMDHAGNLYIAEYGGGRIIIVGSNGRLRAIIPFPEQYTTAAALIDGDSRIFVTAPVSFVDPKAYGEVYSVANPVYGKN
ncbi:MAG: SMP-30/gluconolactonase/LRE family protein [Bauldia sp.]